MNAQLSRIVVRLLCVVALSSAAFAQRSVSYRVTNNAIADTGSVAVLLTATGGEAALSFTVEFDPAVLRYDGFVNGSALIGSSTVFDPNTTQVSSGRVGFLINYSLTAALPAGTHQVLVLNFGVLGSGAASTTLSFANEPTERLVNDLGGNPMTPLATFDSLQIAARGALTLTTAIPATVFPIGVVATAFTPVTASGGVVPYTFAVSPAFPAGLSLNTATGAIAGTPGTAVAETTHTITVTDSASATATATFKLTVVPKETPVITWPTPVSIVYGTALSATQLNATANVGGSFTYSPAIGTILAANATPQTLSATFTPNDTVLYNSANATRSIVVNKATPTIDWAAPAPIVYGTPLSATQLNATASGIAGTLPGTFAYTPAAGTKLDAGVTAQTLSVAFTPADTVNYTSASTTAPIVVNPAPQTIAFNLPASVALDQSPLALVATATSGAAVTFASSDPTTAAVSGTQLNLLHATPDTTTVTITASQTGTNNYLPADESRPLRITNASQTIVFAGTELVGKKFGDPDFTVTATSNRGLPVTFDSSNSNVATIVGNTIHIVGAGTTNITASHPGNADYAEAKTTLPLVVAPATATVTLGNLEHTYDGTPKAATAVTVPAGLKLEFRYGTPPGSATAPTNAGSYPVTATIAQTPPPTAPESNYVGSDTKTLVIAKATQTITFADILSPKFVNAGSFSLSASSDATPTLPITFTSSNPSVASIDGNVVTILTLGTTTVTAKQGGDTNYLPATDVPQILVVRPVLPVITAHPPLAQTLVVGDTFSFGAVTLNAHSSPVTFTLGGTLPTGLTASSANSTTGAISSIITGTPGTYNLVLTATNASGTDSKTIVLTLNPPAPVFTSPAAVTGTVATSGFTYAAVATNAASYTLAGTLPPGLTFASGVISGTPTQAGTFPVTLTATNVTGSAELTLVIRISFNIGSPVMTSRALVNGQVGATLNYQLSSVSRGATPGATTYAVTGALPSGVTLNPTSGLVSGTPSVGSAGSYPVHFAGTNLYGTGVPLQVTIVITGAANVPVITSNGTAAGQVGQPFIYNTSATNGPLTGYAATGLPAGLSLDAATGAITGIPAAETPVGTPVRVTLTATNATGTSNPKTLLITITSAPGTPVISSGLTANLRVATAFSYTLTSIPAATSYTATGLPPGLGLSGAVISGAPTQSDTFAVSVRGANGAGVGPASTLMLSVLPSLAAPSISSPAGASGTVGTAFTYSIVAAPGPITVYAVKGTLPLGLSLNATSGVISGTPSVSGLSTVEIRATNAGGTSLPQTLVLNIAPAAGVPVITSPGTATGRAGENFTYTITATNVGTAPYAPAVVLEAIHLPAGLAANPSTGVVEGVPDAVGTTIASLVGTNAVGTGPSRALSISILPAATAPVIFSAPLASAQAGVPFAYSITALPVATGYEVLAAPAWLSLNNTTGVISGTPTLPGQVQVQLIARNTAGAGLPVTLTINVAAAANTPVITSTRSAGGTVGAAFAGYTITASNGLIESYLALGLPPGLTLNSLSGAISGTPTSSGTYPVTVSAINATGAGTPTTVTFTIARSVTFGL